jgi:hypothetical protein
MKKYTLFHTRTFIFIFVMLFGLGFMGVARAQTSDDSTQNPVIKTEKTPNGNSITITYPDNFSGEVSTSFQNGEWKTNTKKYTEEDLQKMQDAMKQRQEALRKYLEAQQNFFKELWGTSTDTPFFPRLPLFPFW